MAELIEGEPMDEGHRQRAEILWHTLAGLISTKAAADRLATLSLETDNIGLTWTAVLDAVRKSRDHHQQQLVELLVHLANLPAPTDDNGQQLMWYDMRIWDDLPTFGWDMNREWNGLTIPEEEPERQKTITEFVRINKYTARLIKTGVPVFSSLDIFGLCTMRSALETPIDQINMELDPPDVFIPAAAAWVPILGAEMYYWDKEFHYGDVHGDPGGGGPLWNGQHGFCRERWQVWRKRFGELSLSNELNEGLRQLCKEAEARMAEIEAQLA